MLKDTQWRFEGRPGCKELFKSKEALGAKKRSRIRKRGKSLG